MTLAFSAKIQGVGDALGQWEFTLQDSGSGDPREKPWILDIPSLSGVSADPRGGVRKQGEVSFSVADVGDSLTAQLASQRTQITRITSAIGAANTSIVFVANPTTFRVGLVVAIGRECVRLDENTSGSTWDVTRGFLGTTAAAHPTSSAVYPGLRYTAGRGVTLAVGGVDQGTWWLDAPQLDRTANAWVFNARSPDRVLDSAPTSAWQGRDPYQISDTVAFGNATRILPRTPYKWFPHMGQRVYVKAGDSILRCRKVSDSPHLEIERTGVAGTPTEPDFGDSIREVLVCDPTEPDAYRSFRHSDTSTYPDAWEPTDHPIPIMLAILTSGHPDGQANGSSALGYYALLPFGLGVPASDIDADSVRSVWESTQRATLPQFVFDPGDGSVRELFDKICLYTGITFGWSRGKWRFTVVGVTTTYAIPAEDVVASDSGVPAVYDVAFTSDYMITQVSIGEVLYRFRDFGAELGDDGPGSSSTFELPSDWIRIDSRGKAPEFAIQRTLSLLRTYSGQMWSVVIQTPIDYWLEGRVAVGDAVTFGWPQIPDLSSGVRGISSDYRWIVVEEMPGISEGVCGWKLLADSLAGDDGRIAPSARVVSRSGAVVTVRANYYTDPDNRGGYPTSDASCFRVGDVVRFTDRAGTVVVTSPTSTTISAISGNDITLAHSIGLAGEVLECVSYPTSAQARQLESVFVGVGRTIGRSQ